MPNFTWSLHVVTAAGVVITAVVVVVVTIVTSSGTAVIVIAVSTIVTTGVTAIATDGRTCGYSFFSSSHQVNGNVVASVTNTARGCR